MSSKAPNKTSNNTKTKVCVCDGDVKQLVCLALIRLAQDLVASTKAMANDLTANLAKRNQQAITNTDANSQQVTVGASTSSAPSLIMDDASLFPKGITDLAGLLFVLIGSMIATLGLNFFSFLLGDEPRRTTSVKKPAPVNTKSSSNKSNSVILSGLVSQNGKNNLENSQELQNSSLVNKGDETNGSKSNLTKPQGPGNVNGTQSNGNDSSLPKGKPIDGNGNGSSESLKDDENMEETENQKLLKNQAASLKDNTNESKNNSSSPKDKSGVATVRTDDSTKNVVDAIDTANSNI